MAVLFGFLLTACGGGGGSAPAAAPAPAGIIALPKTGQTTCSDAAGAAIACAGTGQDGELQTGVAEPSPRFVVGTGATLDCVTDNLTGLMWVKAPSAVIATWANALTAANDLMLCGFIDWRLPNVNELESLVNSEAANGAVFLNTQGFTGVQADYYWSSSSDAVLVDGAWFVDMRTGIVFVNPKSVSSYVWPVRAGQ
jgi:Protein of unknown function (DUF1566)